MSDTPAHPAAAAQPARWLTDHRWALPATGDALDVACGRGRHALWLARQGFRVRAVDRDRDALDDLAASRESIALPLGIDLVDLEVAGCDLGTAQYDVIVVFHYLHRPLFPALVRALRSGGRIVYETFTREQARRGKPTNPAFLLEPGELTARFAGLDIVAAREDDVDGRAVASIVAIAR